MRIRAENGGVSVHAVAGSYVVFLGFDVAEALRGDLLGFAVEREDITENERYFLRGLKVFKETGEGVPAGVPVSTFEHPVQSFQWGDYTAKPSHDYVYRVICVRGKPRNLAYGPEVSVRVTTEPVFGPGHSVIFNRGVAGSQAYARRFGNRVPDQDNPADPAWAWLSRGLFEGMRDFVRRAQGPRHALRLAVYEFSHRPILRELKAALERNVDVRIVYDRRGKEGTGDSKKVWQVTERIAQAEGLFDRMTARKTNSAISHNKFMVLLEDGAPKEVWTGSTNITAGGIYGQSNVGHVVADPAVAAAFLAYWQRLAEDPPFTTIRRANVAAQADLVDHDVPPPGTTAFFSPRETLGMLDWYANRPRHDKQAFFLTAAFGVDDRFEDALKERTGRLRYLLLEREDEDQQTIEENFDVKVAVGSFLDHETVRRDALTRWLRENLTDLNRHVRFAHTKFLMVDPLSDDPLIISGSANFSEASTTRNDENMLVIRGDTRVADLYFGEFMRLFFHHYFRYLAMRFGDRPSASDVGFLKPTAEAWVPKHFEQGRFHFKQRLLFR
ncbi:MAG: phospholipase D-like domain-containing protein [Defluviicoccus sp.]